MTQLNLNRPTRPAATANYDPLKWTDNAKIPTQRVEPQYQVKEDGEWYQVKGVEIGDGCLRYVQDGYGKVASAGNWRQELTKEWSDQVDYDQALVQEVLVKEVNRRKIWGIVIFISLLVLFVIFPLMSSC
jgi:hypothetical protein